MRFRLSQLKELPNVQNVDISIQGSWVQIYDYEDEILTVFLNELAGVATKKGTVILLRFTPTPDYVCRTEDPEKINIIRKLEQKQNPF